MSVIFKFKVIKVELPYLISQVPNDFKEPVYIILYLIISLKCYVLCSLFFTSMASNLSDTEYFK